MRWSGFVSLVNVSHFIKYANKFLSEDARLKELCEGLLNSSTILFGRGTQKKWVMVYSPLPKTLTLLFIILFKKISEW